jgi:hypothetical protein
MSDRIFRPAGRAQYYLSSEPPESTKYASGRNAGSAPWLPCLEVFRRYRLTDAESAAHFIGTIEALKRLLPAATSKRPEGEDEAAK